MAFNINQAKQAGYSDAEIADYLGKENNFKVDEARKSGYSDNEIVSHLANNPVQKNSILSAVKSGLTRSELFANQNNVLNPVDKRFDKHTPKDGITLNDEEKTALEFKAAEGFGNVVERKGNFGTPISSVISPAETQVIESELAKTSDPAIQGVLKEQLTRPTSKYEIDKKLTNREALSIAGRQEQIRAPIDGDVLQAPNKESANISNVVSGLADALPQGAETVRQGIRSQFADAIDSESMSNDAQLKAFRNRNSIENSTPNFETKTAQGVYSGATSLIQQIPGMAAAIATGNPLPALASAGLTSEAEAYTRYKARGAMPQEALIGALSEGAVEVLTESIPMSFLVKKFGKVGAGQFVSGLLARDVIPEQAATLAQDAIDTAIANPDKTWGEYLAERPDAAYQTLIATITQAGAVGAVNAGARALGIKDDEPDDITAKKVEKLKALPTENLDRLLNTAQKIMPADVPLIKAEKARRANTPTLQRAAEAGAREIPQLQDKDLLAEVNKATEAIPATDILEGNNVGLSDNATELATDTTQLGASDGFGSEGDISINPDMGRADTVASAPTKSINGDNAIRTDSGSTDAVEVTGDKIDKDWTAFNPDTGTLGIPRNEMPQIKAEYRGAMVNFLNARDISHDQETVLASSLKPTQMEFSEAKVEKALGFKGNNRSILISSDNHILDGHHQWLAKLQGNENVDVIRLNAPIRDLLETVKEFPSATTTEGSNKSEFTQPGKPEHDMTLDEFKAMNQDYSKSEASKVHRLSMVSAVINGDMKLEDAKRNYGDIENVPVLRDFILKNKPSISPKKTTAKKSSTLLGTLRNLGGVTMGDKLDVTGQDKAFAPGGYNQIFTHKSVQSLKGHIENGDLDNYLPYDMRLSNITQDSDAYDSTPAYDYLAERIRNGEKVLPYKAHEEIQKNKFYESENIQDDIQTIADEFNDDEINALLSEAGYDERESNTEAQDFEQGKPASDIVSSKRNETRTSAKTQNEVTGSPGSERQEVKQIVEAIVKRRAAATQLGKIKQFDTALQTAKEFMRGEQVNPNKLKNAATLFKNDKVLADNFTQLHALAKTPAKEARTEKSNAIETYRQQIANAKTQDELQTIARKIQRDTALNDNQATDLDDAVFAAQDALDANKQSTNDVDYNKTDNVNNKPVETVLQGIEADGWTRLSQDDANNYVNSEGNKFRTYKKDGVRIALRPNHSLKTEKNAAILYIDPDSSNVIIEAILVDGNVRKQGKATATIKFLNELADKTKSTLYIEPVPLLDKAMDKDSLISFYEKMGFVAETDAAKVMVRKPNAKIGDLLGDNTAAKQAIADAERAKDAKRNTGNGETEGFTLTGSNSEADKAIAAGAQDLFAQPVKAESKSKVDDFGEKLEGARKDMARALAKEYSDDEIASLPLSKLWPITDINLIENKTAAAIAWTAREEIPSKPRKDYAVKRWVEKVKQLREIGRMVSIALDKQNSEAMTKFRNDPKFSHFHDKVALLEAIDRESWKRIGRVEAYPEAYKYVDGIKTLSPFVRVEIDGISNNYPAATVADVIEKVNEKLGNKAEDKRMAFEVRGRTGAYFINKKGDKNYTKLKQFKDSKEAFAYIKENYTDLLAAWEATKERLNVKESDIRNKENRPRTGEDYRKGKDVSTEEFATTFGFRGVQFGEWVKQGGKDNDRQGALNAAYDALMDLANIIEVPPKALSLEGTLGLAFGARGSGKAAAHFEPNNLVINLTKTQGAGSLAHEWFHALDNYFSRKRNSKKSVKREDSYITYKPEKLYVHKTNSYGRGYTKTELERVGAKSANPYWKEENWIPDPKHPEGVRPEVEERFADLVNALNTSPMKERARAIDGVRLGTDGYWSRIIELGARSFENYVIHKMQLNGYDNDYLANVVRVESFNRDATRFPYLYDTELAPVAEAFDNLFSTIETKETENGDVVLFSRSSKSQTDTPAFKKWFGDSKVVDADGKPLVVYHGSRSLKDFSIFKIGKKGAYFTDSLEAAESYGEVKAVYLDMKNPLEIDLVGESDMDNGFNIEREARYANSEGFDGLIIRNSFDGESTMDQYIVFKPNQIKSAIGNNGDFDGNNNDIRYSRAPTYYSALTRAVDEIKINKAPVMQWKAIIKNLSQKGVKPDEIEWTGVNEWLDLQQGQVTKEQVLDYLNANGVQVDETTLSDKQTDSYDASNYNNLPKEVKKLVDMVDNGEMDERDLPAEAEKIGYKIDYNLEGSIENIYKIGSKYNPTKYSQYTVPGGESYKEMLFRIKAKGVEPYKDSHWNDPADIWVRFDERTDADGNRIIFIHELQSGRGQEGKKKGFKGEELKYGDRVIGNLSVGYEFTKTTKAGVNYVIHQVVKSSTKEVVSEGTDREEALIKSGLKATTPTAPFVTKTDAWVSLAIKRMMRYAVENSFDKVAFINGQQAADLYDLSKQVDSIAAIKNEDGTFAVFAYQGNRTVFDEDKVTEARLPEIIGKELAEKVATQKGTKSVSYSGLDLKVGGKGMRTFYDQIVPKVAKDVLKKLGGGLSQTTISAIEQIKLTKAEAKKAFKAGADVYFLTEDNDELQVEDSDIEDDPEFWDDNKFHIYSEKKPQAQVAFTITPTMRETIMGGLPLFSKSNVSGGMSKSAIESTVNKLTAKWKNAPEIIVVDDMNDAAIRAAVRAENERQLSQGATGQPEGFFDAGKVYIVASEISSIADVQRVLFHETLGHFGLRGTFGKDLDKVLESLVLLRRKDINAKAKQYGLDVTKRGDRLTSAEEVLAEIAQTNPQAGFVKRAIAAIREWLRANGFNLKLTDNDIIINYLLPARQFVMRGKQEQSVNELIAAFNRSDRKPSKESGDTFLTAALEYLARDPEFFQTPASEFKNIADIAKDIDIGYKVIPLGASKTKLKNATKAWEITVPNSAYRSGEIYENENEVWIDVSRLISGNDKGSRIYAIAADYAHNTGKKFKGDPEGLSKKAFYRRNEQMLSSALKHGTTKHLLPHIAQEIPAEYYQGGEAYFGKSVRALNWIEGDDIHNIKELIYNSYRSAIDNVPEIKNVTYNTESRRFEYDDGRPFTNEDSTRISTELSKSVGAYRAGSGTLKRAALFNTFLRKSSQERGREILGALITQLHGNGISQSLKGVMYSRQATLQNQFDAPEPSKMDSLIYALQDKHIDLKRVTQSIKKTIGEISDRWNAYLQEELYHGRAAKRVQDFVKDELEPLINDMRDRGVNVQDLEEYLWMRHAPERNAKMAKINEGNPDGLAGISTQEANDYLNNLTAEKRGNYEALAKRIDAINKKSRQLLLDYGLESADTIAAWEDAYEYYVPLMREDMDIGFGNGTGQGFSIKGNSSKRATGSKRAVVDILANIAQQREKNIVRGEKNRVATALIGLSKLNPNDEFWKVDTPPTITAVSKATGFAETFTDPNYKSRDSVVVARIPDKNGRIQERSVVFNEHNERAMRMAASIKNLDLANTEEILEALSHVTRYFSSVNTQYNPIFGILNITRDVQGALLNLTSTELAGKQADVLKNILPALKGIYADMRSVRKGRGAKDTEWAKLWEEFQNEGGKTGYRDMYHNAKERGEAIRHALDPAWWTKTRLGKIVTGNGLLTVPETMLVDKAVKPLFDWLSDYNETLENSVRLSVYKVALDNGITKQQAASLAKNISVNFNRKGSKARTLGSLYAFFNASVQSTARIAETLNGKRGKQVIAGGLLLGVMQAVTLSLVGLDDDEPPEFVRNKNITIPISDGKYISLLMPLGFNAIPNFSRILTEWALSGGEEAFGRTAQIFAMLMDSLNPIGGSGSIANIISFTATDPFVDLYANKDWTGKPISREDFNSLDPTPGFTRSRDAAWNVSVELARYINYLSGGDDYEPGKFSPTADEIEYLTGQITGGVGREVIKTGTTIDALVTGSDLPTYKIPLVGRFYGNAQSNASQSAKFYTNIEKMNKYENAIKGRLEDGLDVDEYEAKNPLSELVPDAKNSLKLVKNLRKVKLQLIQDGASKNEISDINNEISGVMTDFNQQVKEKNKELSH
jgi:Large polyvalent protein associated domain 38/Large polyvalent protein-associated domain 5/ADP-Ribosyltransferase in polyvalent proteins/Large polyvalent protein-associated domain 1